MRAAPPLFDHKEMNRAVSATLVLSVLIAGLALGAVAAGEPALVRFGKDCLDYGVQENGDRIPDFSCCGYRGGGVKIPDVSEKVALEARDTGDDTERIHNAIDQLATMAPNDDGFRGAVLLKSGTYRVAGTLVMKEGGVVLRGAGQEDGGTVIVATGTYDNVACGDLNVQWRGRSGTGHGWAGANTVFWNCRAGSIDCQKPPTANNYCIGCTGSIRGSGYIASKGHPVLPRSLYLKQLEDRLGKQAVKNVTTQDQREGTIDELLRSRLSR